MFSKYLTTAVAAALTGLLLSAQAETTSRGDAAMRGTAGETMGAMPARAAGQGVMPEAMSAEPMTGGPMSGEPMSGKPMTGKPMSGESMGGGSMTGEPMTGKPMTGEPMTGKPMSGEAMTGKAPMRGMAGDAMADDKAMPKQ